MAEKELKLTVAEEEPAHAGRGTVRLDENVMKKLGVKPGNIIQIKGQKTTGAIGVKGYARDHGLEIARMDGLARRNAGTSIGEKVIVSKANFKEAKSVTLAPAESGIRLLVSGEGIKSSLLAAGRFAAD